MSSADLTQFEDVEDDGGTLIKKWVLPPHGFIRLVGGDANDAIVVNAARVLEEKEIAYTEPVDDMEPRDTDLIFSMMQGRHGTPFEHPFFRFHVCLPIFVVREWQRHRIGSYSEISMRWMKGQPRFYIPQQTDVRMVEPGARKMDYRYVGVEDAVSFALREDLENWYLQSYGLYERQLERGVAPEQARYFLPNTFFTEMQWSVNARALMNFLNLRCAPTAMWEIRQYALALCEFFKDAMPHTAEAFMLNGMVAP